MLFMIATAIFALTCLCGLHVHAAPTDLRSALNQKSNRWDEQTTIAFPKSATFDNATMRWSSYEAPSYFAAVSPANEADLVKTVKIATALKVPFLATGGRHGYTGTLGDLQHGLAIDLGRLKSHSIDSNSGIVTIGGAATVGDFQHELFDAGYMIQGGSASCPGYVGTTVGGGVGRYTGLFGLIIDSLQSARVVTASGRVVTVSKKQNADLFWGMRGAGSNFGIVSSASFQASNLVNEGQVMNADFIFPANMTKQYFDVLETFSGKMPAELAVVTIIYWDPTVQAAQLLANWVYTGPEAEGRRIIAPVIALNPPIATIKVVPWSSLIATAGGGFDTGLCQKGISRNFYSVNLRSLSGSTYQSTFEKMVDYFDEYPDARGTSIDLETFPNQAMAAVPDDATAYPWRDAIGYIQISVVTASNNAANDPAASAGDKLGQELRRDWVETSGYPELSVYVSYAHGDETLEQRYGRGKLARLAALKKRWDPQNFFRWNNGLPMSYYG